MFSKLALFVAATMAVCVVALPGGEGSGSTIASCNTGPVHCCNTAQDSDTFVDNSDGFLYNGSPFSAPVAVSCSPMTVYDSSTAQSCTGQAACCSGNNFNGQFVMACSPLNINSAS